MYSGFSFLQARFEHRATSEWPESRLLGAASVYLVALPIYAATGLWVWTGQMVSRSADEEAECETLVTAVGPRMSGRLVVPTISGALCAALLLAVLSGSAMPRALTALLSLGLIWRIVSVSWRDYANMSQMLKVRARAFMVHFVVCVTIAVSSLVTVFL